MELIQKETTYNYKFSLKERLILVGLIATILDGEKVDLQDSENEVVKKMFDALRKDS